MLHQFQSVVSIQIVQSPALLKEHVSLYEDFTEPLKGYSASRSIKKLVKHLEKILSQHNITEDKVITLLTKLFHLLVILSLLTESSACLLSTCL